MPDGHAWIVYLALLTSMIFGTQVIIITAWPGTSVYHRAEVSKQRQAGSKLSSVTISAIQSASVSNWLSIISCIQILNMASFLSLLLCRTTISSNFKTGIFILDLATSYFFYGILFFKAFIYAARHRYQIKHIVSALTPFSQGQAAL